MILFKLIGNTTIPRTNLIDIIETLRSFLINEIDIPETLDNK